MTDLMINLPEINEEWLEHNIDDLIHDGIELLHITKPDCIAASIGCTEFGEVFNDLEDHTYDNFYRGYPNEYSDAEKQSEECARYLFNDYKLWNKPVVTAADIENYNEVLKELVFQIAENFAHAWCKYLGLPYDEGEYEHRAS